MTERIKGLTYRIIWHSIPDKRRCKICEGLEGYTWTFEEAFPPFLEHPIFGVVWDMEANHSIAHEFQGGLAINCRCFPEIIIDINVEQIELGNGS